MTKHHIQGDFLNCLVKGWENKDSSQLAVVWREKEFEGIDTFVAFLLQYRTHIDIQTNLIY